MTLIRIAGMTAALLLLPGCGTGTMILWNPSTGECDEMPKAAAYALGGGLFAATRDVDAWRCEGLKDGDKARTEKPTASKVRGGGGGESSALDNRGIGSKMVIAALKTRPNTD